ncbi:MAG: hypothetical protein OEY96_00840 [Gammaproteobacteria bacterium]|nr:hypothetical protein [Gammaproteobacteria bacterium]
MKRVAFVILAIVSSFSTYAEELSLNSEIKCLSFHQNKEELCAINSEQSVIWLYFPGPGMPAIQLPYDRQPMTEFYITDIQLSPDEKTFAFVSASEGHPGLTVVDLPSLLNFSGEIQQKVIAEYPHDVSIVGWQNNQLIYEMYYNDFDGVEREAQSQQFLFDLTTGESLVLK